VPVKPENILKMLCELRHAEPPPSLRHRCSYSSESQPCFLMSSLTLGLMGKLVVSVRFALTAFPTLFGLSQLLLPYRTDELVH